MSILDKYPPPWTSPTIGTMEYGEILDARDESIMRLEGPCDDVSIEYDSPALKRLILAAPRLLRALSNIVVMVDGPEHHREMAIADAEALIAEIEGI